MRGQYIKDMVDGARENGSEQKYIKNEKVV